MPNPLYRIAFTSCTRIRYNDDFEGERGCIPNPEDFVQPVWSHLLQLHQQRPIDAMLFLGDQVYSDYSPGIRPKRWPQDRFFKVMHEMYRTQYEAVPKFRAFLMALKMSEAQIGTVWDDHDFGYNNGCGAEAKFRDKVGISKALAQHFETCLHEMPDQFACPLDPFPPFPDVGMERIANPIELGDQVEIVLLDGRLYRAKKNGLQPKGEVLGAAQWAALKQRMENLLPGKLMLVCLGSTYSKSGILSDESWYQNGDPYDHFDEFTQLARDKHILFLTGDVHRNALKTHQGFSELISSGAHMPDEAGGGGRFCVLDVYPERVDAQFFNRGAKDETISQSIHRNTGMP
jgi:alkaline phosphatase D